MIFFARSFYKKTKQNKILLLVIIAAIIASGYNWLKDDKFNDNYITEEIEEIKRNYPDNDLLVVLNKKKSLTALLAYC